MFCHLGIMFGFWMEENNCIDDREKCYQIFRNQTGWKNRKKSGLTQEFYWLIFYVN